VKGSSTAAGTAAFLMAAPGTVAGLVPWLLTGWQARDPRPAGLPPGWWLPARVAGAVLIGAGAAVLLVAFAAFVTQGRGTPAPLAPTGQLVLGGLYRRVRNPMYLAVTAVISGQALLLGQPVLLGYAAAILAVSWAFVHWHEEPALRRRYGPAYEDYLRGVPGWWPRLRRGPGPADQSGQ
jgi:protein-S-isoprenylcysteine O-methyltransferase Ste14